MYENSLRREFLGVGGWFIKRKVMEIMDLPVSETISNLVLLAAHYNHRASYTRENQAQGVALRNYRRPKDRSRST